MSEALKKADGYEGELVLISGGLLTDSEKQALDIDPKDVPNTSYAVPRETYEHIMERIEADAAKGKVGDGVQDRWGTGGNHVAANPEGKYMPEDLNAKGQDPKSNRDYIGGIAQGLIMYAPKEAGDDVQRPAVYDYFGAKTREDLTGKKLTLNITTTGKFEDLPAYMRDEKGSQLKSMRQRKGSAFGGQNFEDALVGIDERTQKQIERVAEDWSRKYGIDVEVVYDQDPKIDPENPHPVITYMGFTKGQSGLAGFANFPEVFNKWGGQLAGYGHNPGFNVLNNDYTGRSTTSDHDIYTLVEHELGHAMGKVHTHDLGNTGRGQQDLALSNMAYSKLQAQGVGPDGSPLPMVEVETGKWMGGLQQLNTHDDMLVDLQDLHKKSYDINKNTRETRNNKLLPVEGMAVDGKGAVLQGSEGNDRLDSNPGYASRVNTPGVPVPQDFALIRGHFERVRGVAGDNIIIGAAHGDQTIEPGPGNNSVEFPHEEITGRKTVESTGKDTLVLSEALITANKLRATEGKDGVELTDGKNAIVLKGGVDKVQVIDANGKTVVEKNARDFTAQDFQQEVIAQVRNRQQSHTSQLDAQQQRRQAGGGLGM